MNFNLSEIVDLIRTLIIPVIVSGLVSYWVSRYTYKYESRHSDDTEIFGNLYKNLLILRDNFFVSVNPMEHMNKYFNVPFELWDDMKKDKRHLIVNKKINCSDNCMEMLYADIKKYNALQDKLCKRFKEIVKNNTRREIYHNDYDRQMVVCWFNDNYLELAGIFLNLDIKNPCVEPFSKKLEDLLKDIDKSEITKLRENIIKRLNMAIVRTKKQIE